MNGNGHEVAADQHGEVCFEEGHLPGCPGEAGGDHLVPLRRRNALDREERRFWAKVDRSGECWLWTGHRTSKGYGQSWDATEQRITTAHRMAYRLAVGPIADGLQVLHRCDNPPCVRPDHLFVGTPQRNMDDKADKGRSRWHSGLSTWKSDPTRPHPSWRVVDGYVIAPLVNRGEL
jgi:hypothetical protein